MKIILNYLYNKKDELDMKTELKLRELKVGQVAEVLTIKAEGEMGRRIRDMGLIPGSEVKIVGRAPLRDPVALRLHGFTLSLRNNEADFITVLVEDNSNSNLEEK